jgi:hypothetical protein
MSDFNTLVKSERTIENGINDIIERYQQVKEKINKTSAYSKEETITRLDLIKERDTLEWCLQILDIQDFELKDGYTTIDIR